MTNKLKLITTETFGDLSCNFYRNMNDDILLTREQIGLALEYSDPMVSIGKIHKRHKDRLDNFSFTILVNGHETYYYTEKGIMEICRWSKSDKANQFMDWVLDIVEKYRNHELTITQQIDITTITEAITSISQAITALTNMSSMKQDIQDLKQSQRNRYLLEKRYPSSWYKKIVPKYKLLMEYFDCNRKELYSSIYKELEDTYDVDINQLHEDYCYENHLLKDECYPMDAIEHDVKLRDALVLLIDSSLIKYGLKTEEEVKNFKRETLFDREPV